MRYSKICSMLGLICFIPSVLGALEEESGDLMVPIRCYDCTTLNASEIVGGAGADPGIFLSQIPLAAVPLTSRCHDQFDGESAIRAGAVKRICDDGLCVKINYTDKATNRIDVLRACLPKSRGIFKESCAKFNSRQAMGTWCICGRSLCNHASSTLWSMLLFVTGLFVATLFTKLQQQ